MKIWRSVPLAFVVMLAGCGARSSLEVPEGALALVDAGPDAEPDLPQVSCEEAGVTFIYVISQENDLYRFYPPDQSFTLIGHINCPDDGGATPYSMAVDRRGKAYVVFSNGAFFTVSTANATCKKTKFKPGQSGFEGGFGMGFSADKSGGGETLFISTAQMLGVIDTQALEVTAIGGFSQGIGSAELTGTGDARLFAFGIDGSVNGSHLAEVDKSSAEVVSDVILPIGQQGVAAWAFAFWGGDFYFFTAPSGGLTQVTRYHPEDGSLSVVAQLDRTVVGAGVSTCAAQ